MQGQLAQAASNALYMAPLRRMPRTRASTAEHVGGIASRRYLQHVALQERLVNCVENGHRPGPLVPVRVLLKSLKSIVESAGSGNQTAVHDVLGHEHALLQARTK